MWTNGSVGPPPYYTVNMPTKCAFIHCESVRNKNSGISFFQFPLNEPQLLSAWIAAVDRKGWVPTASSRICENHFKRSDFYNTPGVKVNRLKPDIIPSENILQDTPQNLNYTTIKCEAADTNKLKEINKHCIVLVTCNDKSASNTNVQTKILTDTGMKCNAIDMLKLSTNKYRKIEEENEKLKELINVLKTEHAKAMKTQAEMFRCLIKNEKETSKRKIIFLKAELKLWKRKTQRKEVKIRKLVLGLKNKSLIGKETTSL